MNTIIEKIRAEVNRLMRENSSSSGLEGGVLDLTYEDGINTALNDVLEILDTLQEQPVKTNIVEDLKHYLATTPKEQIEKDWESLKEWGKVGPTVSEFLGWKQPVCDGLEEEIDKRWKEWLSEDKEQAEGILPKSEFSFYARHFYELGKQSKKRELLPMIERICVSCPEKVKAESALNKFISKNCVHCSIEHCPGVKACYTSSNEQLQ